MKLGNLKKKTCFFYLKLIFTLFHLFCHISGRQASAQGPAQPSDEYAEEAYALSKGLTLQHEVKIEIEGVDRVGNFIGQLITAEGNVNLSVALVEHGYASVFKSSAASNSGFFTALVSAEQRAKDARLNVKKEILNYL